MFKRLLLTIGIILLLAGQGWAGETYYVCPAGTPGNTPASPYGSWVTAANSIGTIVTRGTGQSGPHTVYISPGTYSEAVYLNNSNWNSCIFQGTSAYNSTSPAASGQVIITNASSYSFRINTGDGCTINDLYIGCTTSNKAAMYMGGCTNLTVNRCTLNGDYIGFDGTNINPYTLNACTFILPQTGTNGLNSSSGSVGTLNYCLFTGRPNESGCTAILNISTGGTETLNNCVFEGFNRTVIQKSSGTLTANNCILHAGDDFYSGGYIAYQSGTATININTSLLIPPYQMASSATYFYGTVGDSGNIKTANPGYKKHRRTGILIPCMDDSGLTASGDYANSLASVLSARGLKGQWYVYPAATPAYNIAIIQSLAAGTTMAIGVHSRSDTDCTKTTAFTTTKSNSTIQVDRAGNVITLCTPPGTPIGTVSSFKGKTISAIKTELAALGATNSTGASYDIDNGEMLDDTGGAQSCATGYALPLLIDTTAATGFFYEEINRGKADLETMIGGGFVAKGFANPLGTVSANISLATYAAGFQYNRPGLFSATLTSRLLNNLDIFQVPFLDRTKWSSATDSQTQMLTRCVAEQVLTSGHILFLLAHNTTELSMAQWGLVLDTLKTEYPDILITSGDGAIDYIKTSGLWTDDSANHSGVTGRYYVRTWADASDYRLQTSSACLKTGARWWTPGSPPTDYYGRVVPDNATPNIGLDGSQPGGGGLSLGLGLSGGNHRPQ